MYITTPIYYVNAAPHIGHIYTSVCADAIARFHRLNGKSVHFLTGTDEHGQKIQKAAEAQNMEPQAFCDKISKQFEEASIAMGITYDNFARTSRASHKEVVKHIWNVLLENDNIYLGKYCGWYSVRDEAFYDEKELVDGKAPTGAPVEWVEEDSYFFRLSKWQDKLLEFYEKNPNFVLPHGKYNEVKAFVQGGLKDLSVSRTSFSWGVEVPSDPKHVMYVWLDALFIYYSAIQDKGVAWPADLHIVGKDILRFHAVYWPAFLMAANLPLPGRIFAHGWWLVEGEKMSKSLGNVIDPFALKEEFGLDYLRYYLVREMPFGNDHSYSRDLFIARINGELCNNIGNLCQRVAVFAQKNADNKVPNNDVLSELDRSLLEQGYNIVERMNKHMETQALQSAFEEVVKLGRLANEYIDQQAPWNLRKTDRLRMDAVVYTLLEVLRIFGIALQPLVPDACNKLLNYLGVAESARGFDAIKWEHRLPVGKELGVPQQLFPRL